MLTPALDLSGPPLVVQPLMTGQLVRDLGHGSRDGRTAGRRRVAVRGHSSLLKRLPGNLFAGVRPDDVQRDVTTVLSEQDDAGRLVTGEAQQFDRAAGDLSQWRR